MALSIMKLIIIILLYSIIFIDLSAQLQFGTYVSDKTKEILVIPNEDSLILINPKAKKIFVKKELNLYTSLDLKDTLKITIIGNLDKDNYLGIRVSDNPKRMFDFFDGNFKVANHYMQFIKENLNSTYSSFETGNKVIVDIYKNTFTIQLSPKKENVYKIYSIDYPNHKIVIWNNKKQKEDVIFKLGYRNIVIEYQGKKYYLSE